MLLCATCAIVDHTSTGESHRNEAGITPTIVVGRPSSAIARPTTPVSPPKRRIQ